MTSLAQNILGDGDITGSMMKPETRTETYFSKMNCESILFLCLASTRPLPWRADAVNEYFRLLDERCKAGMTSQQKRQSVSRILGLPSERMLTGVPQYLLWAVHAD